MDIRKKNLNPELKAIYDRVMNTSVTQPQNKQKMQASTPSQAQNNQQKQATDQQPQSNPPQNSHRPAPPQAQAPEPNQQSPNSQSENNAPFLSSLPPRPLNSTSAKPFVFSSKDKKSDSKEDEKKKVEKIDDSQTATNKGRAGSSMISSKIIYLLGGVFLVVYSLFWLKVFSIF